MRIVDLDDIVTSAHESLSQAAASPSNFLASCGDLTPEELCRYIADLADLAHMASYLAGMAANSLAE